MACISLKKDHIRIMTINELLFGDDPGYNNNAENTSSTSESNMTTSEMVSQNTTIKDDDRLVEVTSDDVEIEINTL